MEKKIKKGCGKRFEVRKTIYTCGKKNKIGKAWLVVLCKECYDEKT